MIKALFEESASILLSRFRFVAIFFLSNYSVGGTARCFLIGFRNCSVYEFAIRVSAQAIKVICLVRGNKHLVVCLDFCCVS